MWQRSGQRRTRNFGFKDPGKMTQNGAFRRKARLVSVVSREKMRQDAIRALPTLPPLTASLRLARLHEDCVICCKVKRGLEA